MGMRFRKSKNLGGFRLNLSKSGIGGSVGCKGFRVTKKANGGTRTTLSVPGTGLSYVKETGKKPIAKEVKTYSPASYKALGWTCRILSIPMMLIGILLTFATPVVGVIVVAIGVGEIFLGKESFKKAKELEEK